MKKIADGSWVWIVRRGMLGLAIGLMSACGTGGSPAEASSPEPGRLVIVGGALSPDNEVVYRSVLEGRLGEGPLCVLPTASAEPAESMATAVERLDRWGGAGTATGVLISEDAPERADDPDIAALLRSCAGFYFTGGSQTRIVATFLPEGRTTPAREALMARWREGAVVAGSSAGAAMMGGRMIAGGSSLDAFEVGVGEGTDGVGVGPGMGFFEQGWLDQHFLARGRWGRLLMAALRAPPYSIGYGIDENTALVVEGGQARVVGASGVVVIDARAARGDEVIDGVTLELLGRGDRIDLESLEVTAAADKGVLEVGASPSGAVAPGQSAQPDGADPFARWALLRDLAGLARSDLAAAGLDYTFGAGWRIELTPASDFRIRWDARDGSAADIETSTAGPEGTPDGLAAGPFRVRITVGS